MMEAGEDGTTSGIEMIMVGLKNVDMA